MSITSIVAVLLASVAIGGNPPSGMTAVVGAPGFLVATPIGQAAEDASAYADLFLQEFGAELQLEFDFRQGVVREIFGRPMDPGLRPTSDAEYEFVCRDLIDRYSPLFGFDAGCLQLRTVRHLDLEAIGTRNKVAVVFDQEYEGIEVLGASVAFVFLDDGTLISVSSGGLGGVQSREFRPELGETQATEVARTYFGHDSAEVVSLGLYWVPGRDERAPRLAFAVELLAPMVQGELPIQEKLFVDAENGDLIRRWNSIHTLGDVRGKVEGWVSPGLDPDAGRNPTEVKEPLHFVHVDAGAYHGDTDTDGNFLIKTRGSGSWATTVDFDGDSRYALIENMTGKEISKTKTLDDGVSRTFRLNTKKTRKRTAQLNAHKHTVRMIRFMMGLNRQDDTLDRQFLTRVNSTGCCNAYYNGWSTTYYDQGCGCVNAAYSTVVYHELGHWANDLYGSGNGADGFGEGNADNFSTHTADDPIVGKDFLGTGNHIRDARNTRQYCNNRCGDGCHGGKHADGEVLMGAMWKVRTRLNASLGDAAGDIVSNYLFSSWMNAYDDQTICTSIRTHYLILDDDDGNIDNGTPHSAEIDGGFQEQGFPGYY